MVFSSNLFLYLFFPPVVFLHTLALIVFPKSTAPANATLLLVSILLYYWGNGPTVVLLGLTILITAGIGHKISVSSAQSGLRLLWIGAGLNLLALFYYKYFAFTAGLLLPAALQQSALKATSGGIDNLPVGISFYTFMAISYLVEVWRRKVEPANLLTFGTYLSMFPHLIAGPIVRYSEIEQRLVQRTVSVDRAFEGLWRFSIGFGQKVILAPRRSEWVVSGC